MINYNQIIKIMNNQKMKIFKRILIKLILSKVNRIKQILQIKIKIVINMIKLAW